MHRVIPLMDKMVHAWLEASVQMVKGALPAPPPPPQPQKRFEDGGPCKGDRVQA